MSLRWRILLRRAAGRRSGNRTDGPRLPHHAETAFYLSKYYHETALCAALLIQSRGLPFCQNRSDVAGNSSTRQRTPREYQSRTMACGGCQQRSTHAQGTAIVNQNLEYRALRSALGPTRQS